MNTRTLLFIFTLLVLTMISSLTLTVVLTIDTINKPTNINYTININQYENTYTNTYNTYNAYEPNNKILKKTVHTRQTQKVETTNGYSNEDIRLLAKLIHAEAKGESFKGKVAVGNVVLNRLKSDQFPDTIKEIIYQPKQFQPVSNGTINEEPSKEAIRAAHESIKTNLIGNAIFFYNPDIATVFLSILLFGSYALYVLYVFVYVFSY